MCVFARIVCDAVPDCVYRAQVLLQTPTITCAVSLAVGSRVVLGTSTDSLMVARFSKSFSSPLPSSIRDVDLSSARLSMIAGMAGWPSGC